ncbi:MAG: hypothetical protein ACUZ8H_04415 [Candidatus Anammoxibacter sp.]
MPKCIEKYILVILVTFVVASSFGVVISKWEFLEPAFFQIKLIELLSIIVTIAVVGVVANLINKNLTDLNKKKDLFLDLVNELIKIVDKIYKDGKVYMDGGNDIKESQILNLLKSAGNQIDLIDKISSDQKSPFKNNMDKSISDDHINMKKYLTGTPFYAKERKYKPKQLNDFTKAHETLKLKLTRMKIKLYS